VQAKAWCFVLVPNKPSKGLVYLTTKSLVLWWVRCGYILHPSFSLVLGLVLRERIRCKGKGVKITNLNLDIPYTTDEPSIYVNLPKLGQALLLSLLT
jgi:hypothetical protein